MNRESGSQIKGTYVLSMVGRLQQSNQLAPQDQPVQNIPWRGFEEEAEGKSLLLDLFMVSHAGTGSAMCRESQESITSRRANHRSVRSIVPSCDDTSAGTP